MKIRRIPIEQLQPAPYNPRIELAPGDERYDRLANSLSEFDLVQPLVWNERTGHVVGGHQRLEILRRRGDKEIECVVVDLPLEREQALNVTLNNPRVGGDWEPEKLVDLLEELQSLPDFDIGLTGFDEQALQELVLSPPEFAEQVRLQDASGVEPESGVTVVLEVPDERWLCVEAKLNALIAEEPEVEVHVRH
ncbi:MAG: ParB N-terminal domain-containing protein [Planctomycetaceae bacterium]